MNSFSRYSGDRLFKNLMIANAASYIAFICIL